MSPDVASDDVPTARGGGATPVSSAAFRSPARYDIGRRLGEGGMGVVWEAHDRVLDRPVALKFLHDELLGADFQARLTDEARAMARLQHPNVVTVFDVGEQAGRTYLAMELVRGATLARWLDEHRDWRSIVALFRGAASGLAAAHAAGIVHRDIKPGNILVGDDGRARVADFGIAASASERVDSGLPGTVTAPTGTPLYMAPERAAGGVADAHGDQYSFFVALYEALHRRMPFEGDDHGTAPPPIADLPAWLHAAVVRGLSRDPSRRFPTMDAVITALTPPRRHARWISAGVVASLAIAIAAVAIGRRSAAVDRCGGGADELATAWNPALRDRVAANLRAAGAYGASQVDRVTRSLDHAGETWMAAHRGACVARTRGGLGDELHQRRQVCLARSRASIATIAEVLTTVTPDTLADAIVAVRAVDDGDDCAAAQPVDAPPPPAIAARADALAARIARARVLAIAASPDAVGLAAAAVADADALGFAPLAIRARLVLGLALSGSDPTAAVAPLQRAMRDALALGDDAIAVEAYARAVFALGTDPAHVGDADPARELGGFGVMEPIAGRLGGRGAFARALFFNNVGVVMQAAGDRTAAREWLRKALAEVRRGARPDDVELAQVPANLALVVDDDAERRALFDEAFAAIDRGLGADHPIALDVRMREAMVTPDSTAATAKLAPSCDRYATLHPHQVTQISECSFELGWLAVERGDAAAARAAFARVTVDETLHAIAAGYVATFDDPEAAAATLAALGERDRGADAWWVRATAADAYFGAALAFERAHAIDRAIAALDHAVRLLDGVVRGAPIATFERRLARCRATLARLVASSGTTPPVARRSTQRNSTSGTPSGIERRSVTGAPASRYGT
jgi:hypothetical protein